MAGGFPLSGLAKTLANPNLFSGGGALGGILGAASPIVGIAGALAPTLFKAISSIGQKRRANRINPLDPGFQMNQGILDNKNILQNNYTNYQMPGFNRASGKIGSSYGTAFNNGIQGASSSGDVLDLATKLAYGQSQAIGDLETQNAIGKEGARGQFLNANALAGNEAVKKNEYERMIYQQKLREKAALLQGSNENAYGAVDEAGSVIGATLNPKKAVTDNSGFNPTQYAALVQFMKDYNIQGNAVQ